MVSNSVFFLYSKGFAGILVSQYFLAYFVMRRVHRRKRPIDYILPFLVLLSIGVIGVMALQVWQSWNKQGEADVFFYIAEGKAKVLPYGQTDWDNAFSGTKLLLGDSLKTSRGGRVVVEFFNDTRVRLNEDTAVTLSDVSKTSERETIALNLDNGAVWVNGQKSAGVRESHYEVRTPNILVRGEGTIFEVENDQSQIVRVFEGDVKVDIMVDEGGQERIADTIAVGVGQEIVLDDATLRAFANNETPSVLKAVSDDFKSDIWYRWNNKEDKFPTDFNFSGESGTMEFSDTEESLDVLEEGETQETTEDDEANNPEFGEFASPKITSPTSTTVTESSFVLSGTASAGTAKIIVNSALGDYELSQFKEGDTTWSYNISESFGNLKEGKNLYKVYAEDAEGKRSTPAEITVTYDKDAVEVEGDLMAPKVESFNGGSSSTVTSGTVTIVGSVSGAAKVVVSGYTLGQFSPGSTQWKYVASEALGNLSPGENSFEVYAVDSDGNKSHVVTFTVTYEKSESSPEASPSESASTQEEPTAEASQESSNGTETTPETSGSGVSYGF